MHETLTDSNFLLYAMNNYDNPQCHTIDEFEDDFNRFMYVKKLLSRYRRNGELKERLILNHIIILYNVFGVTATILLFHSIAKESWSALSTFLVYLERMPETLPNYFISSSDIELDSVVAHVLAKL